LCISHREGGTQSLIADGQECLVPEAPGVVTINTLGRRNLESIGIKDDAPIGCSSCEVSDDGRTLTATRSGINASGKAFDQVIVFDRK